MNITRKKIKIEPDAIYVAIDSFVGETVTVQRGQRLRGSHAAVQLAPTMFLPDGADDTELAQARGKLMSFLDESVDEAPGPIAGPIPPERRRIVVRPGRFTLNDGSMLVLNPGDVADSADPRVQAVGPEYFRKPTREEQNREET